MSFSAHKPLPPSAQDAAMARISGQLLSRYAQREQSLTLRIRNAGQESPIELPARAVAMLMDILDAMAAGQGVALLPESAELTTVEAAEALNVSRPFLIKLLEEKAIPHRKVGKHRRVRMEDVLTYKRTIDQQREAVLEQMAREAQEQDMGYPRK